MQTDLTNLLPSERKRAIARGYVMRLGTVAALVAAALVVLHGVGLAPTYVYLVQQIGVREEQLSAFVASTGTIEEQRMQARLSLLEENAQRLIALADRPTASASFQSVLATPRTGIRITGLTYAPGTSPDLRKVTVKGMAANREVLRSYVQALDGLPAVDSAELPISAYAKERDIEFVLTLTGTFVL